MKETSKETAKALPAYHPRYEAMVQNWRVHARKSMLLWIVLLVVGILLSAIGVGVIIVIIALAMIVTQVSTRSAFNANRAAILRNLKAQGRLEKAMQGLDNAKELSIGESCVLLTPDYLFYEWGLILPIKEIVWIYSKKKSGRWNCVINMLNGKTYYISGVKKIKDAAEFNPLIEYLQAQNRLIQVGNTAENKQLYSQRKALSKDLYSDK